MLNDPHAVAEPPPVDLTLNADLVSAMRGWRQDIHAHPELAYQEHRTAAFVADTLREAGVTDIRTGIGQTGILASLRRGNSDRAIMLRADMDALPMQETGDVPYKSRHDGVMHACGHDGHTSMLLGAACHLAAHGRFDGTVHLIFQPAEENERGAEAMIKDGLFGDLVGGRPVQGIFGMHNMPGLSAGHFRIRKGPIMAGFDGFDVTIKGVGGHSASPHDAVDPIPAAAALVQAAQTIVARHIDPLDAVALSITTIHGGTAINVIPEQVTLSGGIRALSEDARARAEDRFKTLCREIASAHGCRCEIDYRRNYPVLVNHDQQTEQALAAAQSLVGPDHAQAGCRPILASEDFAFYTNEVPGAFIFIGNGPGAGGCLLHNPHYDFNDAVLPLGAAYWVRLTESLLAAG